MATIRLPRKSLLFLVFFLLTANAAPRSGRMALGQPIAVGPDAYTSTQWQADKRAFYALLLPAAFESRVGKDSIWLIRGRLVLERIVEHLATGTSADYPTIEQVGSKILDQGCDDPLVKFAVGLAQREGRRNVTSAEPLLAQAIEEMAPAGYSPVCRLLARIQYARYLDAWGREEEAAQQYRQVNSDYVEIVQGAARDRTTQRILFDLMRWDVDNIMPTPLIGELCDALEAADGVDAWMRRAMRGLYHLEAAWKARGGAFAAEVKPGQWEGFDKHLKAAAAELLAAYKLDPKRPEPAECMIAVTMGGVSVEGLSERHWFDRCVAAHLDWSPAYQRYLYAMRPRWGGDYFTMMQFAHECAETNRPDTLVAIYYYRAMRDVCKDMHQFSEGAETFQLWDDPVAYEKLIETLEAFLKKPHSAELSNEAVTAMIAAAWRSRRFEDARDRLLGLTNKTSIDADVLAAFCAREEDLKRESHAYGGPNGAAFRKADEAFQAGDWKDAAEQYQELRRVIDEGQAELRKRSHDGKLPRQVRQLASASVTGNEAAADLAEARAGAALAMDQFVQGQAVYFEFLRGGCIWKKLYGTLSGDMGAWRQGEGGVESRAAVISLTNSTTRILCEAPFGNRWELEGTVDFSRTQRHDDVNFQVLMGCHPDVQFPFHYMATLLPKRMEVTLGNIRGAEDRAAATFEGRTLFRVQLWDDWASIAIDGKVVLASRLPSSPDRIAPGPFIGLGTSPTPGKGEVVVSDLRIRRLDSVPEPIQSVMREERRR